MWRRCIDVSLRLVVGLVLTANMAIAQDEDMPEHLNFEQFKAVVDASELGVYGTLTYEWMKFINPPSVEHVVPLYEYKAELIENVELSCSSLEYETPFVVENNKRALLVNSAVSTNVIASVSQEERERWQSTFNDNRIGENENWALVGAVDAVDAPEKSAWDRNQKESILNAWNENQQESIEPFWYEAEYADWCELQELVKNSDNSLNWRRVRDGKLERLHDAKLRRIIYDENRSADEWTFHVIVAEPIPKIKDKYVEYFAECQDGNLVSATSLCK